MTVYKFKFDFEIGTFKKSPCRDCSDRSQFPKCIDLCKILEKIQRLLSETRSISRSS